MSRHLMRLDAFAVLDVCLMRHYRRQLNAAQELMLIFWRQIFDSCHLATALLVNASKSLAPLAGQQEQETRLGFEMLVSLA